MKRIIVNRKEVGKGYQILVNRAHPLNIEAEKERQFAEAGRKGICLEVRAASMLLKLLEDIGAGEGITAVSGYRSFREQRELYESSISSKGREFTEKYVAYPGCSEHQTGYAIDLGKTSGAIDFLCPDFPYEGICQKFRDRAADYGFIERYEKEKEEVTGIGQEPWHFRYVSYPHSRIIRDNNLSLEEYTAEIEKHLFGLNPLVFREKEKSIEISCLDMGEKEEREILVQKEDLCQISGNNRKGVVVTLWKGWKA